MSRNFSKKNCCLELTFLYIFTSKFHVSRFQSEGGWTPPLFVYDGVFECTLHPSPALVMRLPRDWYHVLLKLFEPSVCSQGTLKLEIPLASGVSGVVTRDAKGSGQGKITITDGNNLDMPAEFKFPEARKRLVVH